MLWLECYSYFWDWQPFRRECLYYVACVNNLDKISYYDINIFISMFGLYTNFEAWSLYS